MDHLQGGGLSNAHLDRLGDKSERSRTFLDIEKVFDLWAPLRKYSSQQNDV